MHNDVAPPSTLRKFTRAGAGLLTAALACATLATTTSAAPAEAAPQEPAAQAASGQVLPVPQETLDQGIEIDLSGAVTIVTSQGVDEVALNNLKKVIADAGGTATVADTAPGTGVVVYLGQGSLINSALDAIGAEGISDLPAEGYQIASGNVGNTQTLVLAGADERGSYYATTTLAESLQGSVMPAKTIRDYPLMPIRGTIEGFYGIPWSHQARMDLLAFSGEHKLNTYIYTPKDDPLLRSQWRKLYSGDALDQLGELVDQANDHHVDFTFALSPGNSICYSSDEDYNATIKKFEQLRDLGVTSFYVALDDIPLDLRCDSDKEKYPNTGDWHYLADAQADYLNRIETEWIEPNGLPPLQTVPTNYNGSNEDPYKAEFGTRLDDDIRIQWTGEGVFSDQITVDSVKAATKAYRTDHLYIWDNLPVNDGRRDRLFLNPLEGRATDLYKYIDGFTSNPMIEPYASWIALAGYADYTWNPPKYDAQVTQSAILDELAGENPQIRKSLETFVDLNQHWPYRGSSKRAPQLSADVDAYWKDTAGEGADALEARLDEIEAGPQTLKDMAEPGFYADSEPWIVAASQWAQALKQDISVVSALAADDGEAASDAYIAARAFIELTDEKTAPDQGPDGSAVDNLITPSVGDGVFDQFDKDTIARFDDWLGISPNDAGEGYSAKASTSMGTWGADSADHMTDGDLSTLYWSSEAGDTGQYVQVDLGEVKPVGHIEIHQSDSDDEKTDMFYHAKLQYSSDGEAWEDLGSYENNPVIVADLTTPVQARYVRLIATADNPGNKWVKVREFTVAAQSSGVDSTLEGETGFNAVRAFDGTVGTEFRAAEKPGTDSYIAMNYASAQTVGTVTVVGTGEGEIQLNIDGEWTTVGQLGEDKALRVAAAAEPVAAAAEDADTFHTASFDPVEADGIRILFKDGSEKPVIYEVVTSEEGSDDSDNASADDNVQGTDNTDGSDDDSATDEATGSDDDSGASDTSGTDDPAGTDDTSGTDEASAADQGSTDDSGTDEAANDGTNGSAAASGSDGSEGSEGSAGTSQSAADASGTDQASATDQGSGTDQVADAAKGAAGTDQATASSQSTATAASDGASASAQGSSDQASTSAEASTNADGSNNADPLPDTGAQFPAGIALGALALIGIGALARRRTLARR